MTAQSAAEELRGTQELYEFTTVTLDADGRVVARPAGRARRRFEELGGGVSLELLAVPGGSFLMGSPAGEGFPDEHPQHAVTVAPLWLGRYPVTQEQWAALMPELPPCRCPGARHPVENVTWHDAAEFCRRLAERCGRPYTLPGEAQWEYACRAGTTTPFYCGETIISELANYVGEVTYRAEAPGIYRHCTTAVGSFAPNGFGLHDMHGNLWEWCADAWHDDYSGAPSDDSVWVDGETPAYRVARGGCWHDGPNLCRSAARLRVLAREGDDLYGFRVALAGP